MTARKALETLLKGAFDNEELELFVARIPGGIDVLGEVGEPGRHGARYPQLICRELVERRLLDDSFFRALAALKPDRADEVEFTANLVYDSLQPPNRVRRTTAPGTAPPVRPAVAMQRADTFASESRTRVRAVSGPITVRRAPSLPTPTGDAERAQVSIATRKLRGEGLFFYAVALGALILHVTSGLGPIAEILGSGLSDLGPGTVPGGAMSWLVTSALLGTAAGTILVLFSSSGDSEIMTVPGRALGLAAVLYLAAAVPYGISLGAARPTVLVAVGVVGMIWVLTGPLDSRAGTSRTPYWVATLLLGAVLRPLVLGALQS